MILSIHPDNPSPRHIEMVVNVLKKGGLVIFPTDTVYGLGCSIDQPKAVDQIARIKGIKKENANFSAIFNDLSMVSEYTKPIDNTIFRMLRRNLPGPFTFILNANNNIPRIFQSKKKTIGIRIPQNNIVMEIVKAFGHPLLTTSIHDQDEIVDYTTDPYVLEENYGKVVDLIIEGGFVGNEPSTVIDCTTDDFEIIRQGKGVLLE
ncbi:MAG: threonylcarbamoyl-AMP synthase [Bacteroidales bacterium]|jgi:tRNA threonylcarbamoyl adenosine modification protein (Sua5/YciO/YrdC/YwlC family)|nr:threonylcarbamoyl-AMP synthase [Bacteroidota bacterium]MCF8348606.1 threonylcarbamoyl-AMP synthase [Bacteroidales bacterium]